MSKKEGRYRRVRVGLWTDTRFRSLPKTEPSARHLYWFLRTGPHTTMIPGVFQARGPGLADDLGWGMDDFNRCFGELVEANLTFADWNEGLVFIPDVIVDESPRSVNQIEGWRLFWVELPECELKTQIRIYFGEYFKAGPKAFYSIFLDIFGRTKKENSISSGKKPERNLKSVPEETRTKSELTVNSVQEPGSSVQEPGFKNSVSVPKPKEIGTNGKAKKSGNTNSDKPVIRGKQKVDPKSLEQKKGGGYKRKSASDTKSRVKVSIPEGDLFALPDAEHKVVLELLEGKHKGDGTNMKQKKLTLEALQRSVLTAYETVKGRHTGSSYHRLRAHGKEAANRIGVGCVMYRLQPEDLIDYWAKNDFTGMKFPTLAFISSAKNIESAAAVLSGSNRRKKGYIPVDERFEDDSEDDSEELQILAKRRNGKTGTGKGKAAKDGTA